MKPAIVRIMAVTPLCLLALGTLHATEKSAPNEQELTEVTVTGDRPTSLPWEIPTTIETIDAAEIARKINATDAEDALKYFPGLLVRKRYIGDYDHAILASRASGTGNSARSMVYADGILLSNLLGNGATFTPRWGMVAPEEIERVSVLYGPFSAAYPGKFRGRGGGLHHAHAGFLRRPCARLRFRPALGEVPDRRPLRWLAGQRVTGRSLRQLVGLGQLQPHRQRR